VDMASRIAVAMVCVVPVLLVGCGSGGSPLAPDPSPDRPGADVATHEVGPLVVRTASPAGFVAQEIPTGGEVALVALHGSTIHYLASQAMLDRILFSYGGASPDIWVCDLDGSNRVQLTDNAADEGAPCWSPDGTMITFEREWPSQDYEIMLMNADGSGTQALTDNNKDDMHPSFGPVGRRIAFESYRDGNFEIYTMFRNGADQTNITNESAADRCPDWSPDLTDPRILFCSTRDEYPYYEIYDMNPDGSDVARRTTTPASDVSPEHGPDGNRMTFQYGQDVFVRGISYGTAYDFSASPGDQRAPSWSTDGRFICYASDTTATGDWELVLQETDEPYSKFALTHNSFMDRYPDLGGPTLQTDRVLIGPPGSDWGGNDPVWASAYAGIVAFGGDGYENLVRIGIGAAHVGSLQISPLSEAALNAERPAGVVVEATKIVNLREDAGRGREPTVWDLDALNLTAAVLYFDPATGKLVSVLALRDAPYPSAAGSPGAAVTERTDAGRLVVEGDFSAVFDSEGRKVAPDGASRVTLSGEGTVLESR